MSGRKVRGAGAKPAPRTTKKLVDPNQGPWFLNFLLLDTGGPFAWPKPGEPDAVTLLQILQTLNGEMLEQVRARTRESGGAANKFVDLEDLCEEAVERLQPIFARLQQLLEVHADEEVEPFVLELTVCYRRYDPRRIWCLYEPERRCVYPIWWDPKHEVCGNNPAYEGRSPGGQCAPDCPHPPEATSSGSA